MMGVVMGRSDAIAWSRLLALPLMASLVRSHGNLRSSFVESLCSGLGVPPRESKRYGFYLGLALARSAELGRTECLKAILDLRDPPVDVNVEDSSGLAALAHACRRGDQEPFRELLPRADVRCARWRCHAPLSFSASQGHSSMAR